MKTITIIACLFFSLMTVKSANADAEAALLGALDQLHTAESTEAARAAVNQLERIAMAEPGLWQVHYHHAYGQVMLSFRESDTRLIEQLLDRAEAALEKAYTAKGDSSELLTLHAFIFQARINADGSQAMEYSMQANKLLSQAIEKQADNPRALFLMGQNLFYTPEAYGGGKGRALPLFEKSMAAFESNEPQSAIDPFWGQQAVQSMLDQY
jgi:hypothetical protein